MTRISECTKRGVASFALETSGKTPYIYEMRKDPRTGKCVFLKDDRCAIYGERPLICRFYPFELTTQKDGTYVFTVTSECPGIRSLSKQGGKELDDDFFRGLLRLATSELARSDIGESRPTKRTHL